MKDLLINSISAGHKSKFLPPDSDTVKCHWQGEGPLTLIFDAGMGNWSLFFKPLADQLDRKFKIGLLDRPGYSPTDQHPGRSDANSIARQLQQVLANEGIADPIILVGHSMGGLNLRMFQSLYPEMVKGMILIDAANPNMMELMPAILPNLQAQIIQMKKVKRLAKFGLLKFAKKQIPSFGLKGEYLEHYYKTVTRAFYYETYIREMETLNQSLLQCKNLGSLGNLPLLVISSRQGLNSTHKEMDEKNIPSENTWMELQKDLASLSTNSICFESEGDHFIHLSDPVLVINAILFFYDKYFKTNFP